MVNYLRKLALMNPADPSEFVVLTNIHEGTGGTASMFYTTETEFLKVDAGDQILDRQTHKFELQVLRDATEVTQLLAWRNAQTPLYVAALGLDGGISNALNSGTFTIVNKDTFDNVHSIGIMITKTAAVGYVNGKKAVGFHCGENLLANFDVLAGNGSYINGFTPRGTSEIVSESLGVQTYNSNTAGEGVSFNRLFFPFVGERVKIGVNVTSATASDYTLRVFFLEKDGVTEISNGGLAIITTGDIVSPSITIPALTGFLFYQIVCSVGGSKEIVFSKPLIKLSTANDKFTIA